MDFVADALFDGCKLRMLTVVDLYTRECLAIDVGQSFEEEDVVRALNEITAPRGLPRTIKTDNGSEFISKVMDKWAYERGVELDFSRPGKPTNSVAGESFNGGLRQECLNAHWFLSLADAQAKIGAWRKDYNENRPHSALGWAIPAEFARRSGLTGHMANCPTYEGQFKLGAIQLVHTTRQDTAVPTPPIAPADADHHASFTATQRMRSPLPHPRRDE